MFSSLHPETSLRQYLAFVAILLLQFAALGLFRLQSRLPGYRSHSAGIRRAASLPEAVSDLYFQPPPAPAAATPSIPPPAPPTAEAKPVEAPPPPKPAAPPQNAEQAQTDPMAASHAQQAAPPPSSPAAGATPFSPLASWVLEDIPDDPLTQHSGFEQAMPDYTPEPPILHRFYPDAARGKDLVVDLLINEQGVVVGATVIQGIGDGVEPVLMETLRNWSFFPARMQGMAVPSRRRVRFHFPS
jgi:hypothetical protein